MVSSETERRIFRSLTMTFCSSSKIFKINCCLSSFNIFSHFPMITSVAPMGSHLVKHQGTMTNQQIYCFSVYHKQHKTANNCMFIIIMQLNAHFCAFMYLTFRSEERRVGKECNF